MENLKQKRGCIIEIWGVGVGVDIDSNEMRGVQQGSINIRNEEYSIN